MRSGVIAQARHDPRLYRRRRTCAGYGSEGWTGRQVVAHRNQERNGDTAVQFGIGRAEVKNVSKAERARFAVAQVEPNSKLAEFRVEEEGLLPVGAEITA